MDERSCMEIIQSSFNTDEGGSMYIYVITCDQRIDPYFKFDGERVKQFGHQRQYQSERINVMSWL